MALEEFDYIVIGILLIVLLLTQLWRHFFRWDTHYGFILGTHHALQPPCQRADGAAIVVWESKGWDPTTKCTWLVQGLLGAGYRVELPSTMVDLAMLTRDPGTAAAVLHLRPARAGNDVLVQQALDAVIDGGTPRVVILNENGSKGLKSIVRVLHSSKIHANAAQVHHYLITCSREPLLDTDKALFLEALVVRRSNALLRDAELLAVGTTLKWMGN